MSVYEYHGLTTDGREVVGVIDADNPKGARSKLRQIGVYPVEVSDEGAEDRSNRRAKWTTGRFRKRVGPRDVAILTRQLATLLTAGLPLTEALTAVLEQTDRLALNMLIAGIREAVREGLSFADALELHPLVFSPIYIQMARAGEASGHLDEVLLRLSELLEAQTLLRDRIWAALAYPIFLFVTGTLVLMVLMAVVIPRVTAMFADMHRVLPLPTRFLIAFSHFLSTHGWWIAGVGVLGALGLMRYLATPGGRALRDEWFLKVPVVGSLARITAVSRFARTLGTLLASGVPLLPALDAAKRVMNQVVLERAIEQVKVGITEGKGIAVMLARTGVIPPLATHMVAIGEKSGNLEDMLLKAAQLFDREAESMVSGMTSVLAPFMVLIMGVLVLFIVSAILYPIFELSQGIR